jgi:hypothetical protein
VLLKLWDKILEVMPDATLDISSYLPFPNPNTVVLDEEIMLIINHNSDSIKHHGILNTEELYGLISKAEYWLYTCTFCEASCITALEMLMHEVVCLYYPLAGLNDTIGEYGIKVNYGDEIQSIMNLSEERKAEMRINGKKYAMSCSWENRAKEWASVLGLNGLSNNKKNKMILNQFNNNGKSKFNILNLILFSNKNSLAPSFEEEYYSKMIQLQKEYIKSYSGNNITFYFYCYKEDLEEEYIIEDNMIYIKGTESYVPGILEKTMKAFEITKNIEYDFLLRSNISTVVDYSKLNEILHEIPDNVIYAGGSCLIHTWLDHDYGIHKIYNIPFILGTSIILKKEGVNKLIENKILLHETIIDDFAFGLFFSYFGDKPHGFDIYYRYNLHCMTNDIVFYRNRLSYGTEVVDRTIEIDNMTNVIQQIIEREQQQIGEVK